jgi:hypothetical protein
MWVMGFSVILLFSRLEQELYPLGTALHRRKFVANRRREIEPPIESKIFLHSYSRFFFDVVGFRVNHLGDEYLSPKNIDQWSADAFQKFPALVLLHSNALSNSGISNSFPAVRAASA